LPELLARLGLVRGFYFYSRRPAPGNEVSTSMARHSRVQSSTSERKSIDQLTLGIVGLGNGFRSTGRMPFACDAAQRDGAAIQAV